MKIKLAPCLHLIVSRVVFFVPFKLRRYLSLMNTRFVVLFMLILFILVNICAYIAWPVMRSISIYTGFSSTMKHAHLFYVHYLDGDDEYTKENFKFFMTFAYLPCDPNMFYTLVINRQRMSSNLLDDLSLLLGQDIVADVKRCECNEEDLKNCAIQNTKIVVRLNDHGADLCAFSNLLKSEFWMINEKHFLYYFFLNSSVRGPFLPSYYDKKWWEMFTELFEKYKNTVIVGPFMSCEFEYHIQSFLIAVDSRGLGLIKKVWRCRGVDELSQKRKQEWIVDTEVKLGRIAIKKGYDIRSLMTLYDGFSSVNQYKMANCASDMNPSNRYPISNAGLQSMNLTGKNSPDRFAKRFCRQKYVDRDTYAVNLFEVTWVKYDDSLSNYKDRYVPFYTQLLYSKKKLLNFRRGFFNKKTL